MYLVRCSPFALFYNSSDLIMNHLIYKIGSDAMDNIQLSIENLIKTNNGFFKSDAQKALLTAELKKEIGNVFTASQYGSTVILTYLFDESGIIGKEKTSVKTSKTTLVWERKQVGKMSLEDAKNIKHYKKEIKQLEKAIAARNTAFEAGDYATIPELYHKANNSDLERLAAFRQLLNDYVI